MIERSTKTLAQLIDDLLDVSRIIAGKLHLRDAPARAAARWWRPPSTPPQPAARGQGRRASSACCPGRCPPVSGDPGRLQQVVGNLLANAIKFTPEGGRVEVRLERSGPTARITVTDTGSGISPEFLPFIFERFRQADTTSTRKQKGLGLGLAIARQIVQLHGGADRGRQRRRRTGQHVHGHAAALLRRRSRRRPRRREPRNGRRARRPSTASASWSWTTRRTRARRWPCCSARPARA